MYIPAPMPMRGARDHRAGCVDSASAADLVPICESIGANTEALQGRRV
eukprot:COSAG01_NODE_12376_length_1750_cov_10.332526_1_plen_47_part_10